MFSAINIGLSGLVAASSRLQTSANNIANVNTTSTPLTPGATETLARQQAFQPLKTKNTPVAGGGVRATQVAVKPSHLTFFAPGDANANDEGLVDFPNVSLAEKFVQLRIAAQTYKANALVVRTAAEVLDALLDGTKS